MRFHEVDLLRCLPGLQAWDALSPEARLAYARADGHRNTPRGTYGDDERAMLDAGLLDATPTGLRRIGHRARTLHVVLRAADRCRVLVPDTDHELEVRSFVSDSLKQVERMVVLGDEGVHRWGALPALTHRVTSRVWVQELLAARPATWERTRLKGPRDESVAWEPLLTPAVHRDLARLVDEVLQAGGVARLSALFGGTSLKQHRIRALALQAAFRYLVLFPHLDAEDVRLEVGLAPPVVDGLACPPAPPRQVVDVEVDPTPAFWVQDMSTVLVDTASGETRVKANGSELYQKTTERLLAALAPLPPLVEMWAQTDDERRLNAALWALQLLGLIQMEVQPNGRRVLRPAPESRAWLAGSAEDRITALARMLRGEIEAEADDWWVPQPKARRLAPHVSDHDGVLGGIPDDELCDAMRAGLLEIPSEGAVRIRDWMARQCRAVNPLLGTGPGGHAFDVARGRRDWIAPEDCEQAWAEVLSSALALRLIPLGGIALADGEDGPYFALTSVGRYLLRASDTFELPGAHGPEARIVVQPSFDVVFLGPSPEHEALLAPFAERVGQSVGTLFHLSRDAATRAAAAGLGGEEALDRLRSAQGGPIPENVERSVRDWFARVRSVEADRVLLLRCPDEETAARVAVAGGQQATRLGPLSVEVASTQALGRIRKKLAKEGILLGQPPAEARPRKARRRRRRRW